MKLVYSYLDQLKISETEIIAEELTVLFFDYINN